MNNCDKYIELISAYIDGNISEKDAAILNEHLAVCNDCSKLLDILYSIKDETHNLAENAPEGFSDKVIENILNTKKFKPTVRKRIWVGYLAAAACFCVVVFSVFKFTDIGFASKSDSAVSESIADSDIISDTGSSGSQFSNNYADSDGYNTDDSLTEDSSIDVNDNSGEDEKSSHHYSAQHYLARYYRSFSKIVFVYNAPDLVDLYACEVLYKDQSEMHIAVSNETADKITFSYDCDIDVADKSSPDTLVIIIY